MSRIQDVPTVDDNNYYGCVGSNSGRVEEGNMVGHNSDGHAATDSTYGDRSSLDTSEVGILPFVVA